MNLNMENGSVRSSIENVPSTTQSTITLDRKDDDKDEKNDYNPFEHRDVVHPTSTLGAFFHLLKSSLGSGLLAMPAAFRNTGLIPGCIGTVLVGVIATHCVHILVSTSRAVSKNCRAPSLSYTDTCEEVFKQGPKKLQQYSKHIRKVMYKGELYPELGSLTAYLRVINRLIGKDKP